MDEYIRSKCHERTLQSSQYYSLLLNMHSSTCIALFIYLTATVAVLAENRPFRSKKSPAEIITEYEVIHPQVSFGEGQPKEINIHFESNDKGSFRLTLLLNEDLLSSTFTSGSHFNGKRFEESHDNCFYHGTIEGHDQWRAVFSTCYGLRGWFGDLNDPSNLYHIEPIENTTSLTDPHALYMDSEHKTTNQLRTCGTNGNQHKPYTFHTTLNSTNPPLLGVDHHKLKKRRTSQEYLIVELLLVNDFYQYTNFDSNLTAVTHRAIELANHMDLLYEQVNIHIVLVYSQTLTDTQDIPFNNDPNLLLTSFQNYHSSNTDFRNIVHDTALLITGINLSGSTVGLAFVNTMCEYDDAVGLVQDTQTSAAFDGTVASHELGHIFNMDHDDATECGCPEAGCVMNAAIGFPSPTVFSQCSCDELDIGLAQGGGVCLNNQPSTLVGDPVCGNGIREPGEICDCGSPEECTDPCCDASTCTLSAGSQCAEGTCCENCQFKSYGTSCRESRGVCGIEEYCAGDSAECPQDVYLQNASPCNEGTSLCYDGQCRSLSTQCQLYYGNESTASIQRCYETNNVQGASYGHCGVANSEFVPCASENVQCGSLQCEGGPFAPNFNNIMSGLNAISYSIRSVFFGGVFRICQSFTTLPTADIVSPGLVADGTKCGDNQLCISQQCVDVSSLGLTPCPEGSNGEVCSGNGVCNNLDQCSCNIGYTGSDCGESITATSTTTSSLSPITPSSSAPIPLPSSSASVPPPPSMISPTSTSIIDAISSSQTTTTVQNPIIATTTSVIMSSETSQPSSTVFAATPSPIVPTDVPITTKQCLPATNYRIQLCIEKQLNESEVATDCCSGNEFGQAVLDGFLESSCINTDGCPSPVIVYNSCKSKRRKNGECRPSTGNVIKQCIRGTLLCGACEEVMNDEGPLGKRSVDQLWYNGESQEMETDDSVNRVERMAKSNLFSDCPSDITVNGKEYSKTKLKTKKRKGKYCGQTKVKGKDVCDCPTTCP